MTKDYYKILDISEFSSLDEIKSAYRKLARKWHPDVAGNTPSVISRFKEINEAYETLSNRVKKSDYDQARKFYSYAQGANGVNEGINRGVNNSDTRSKTQQAYGHESTTNPNKHSYHTKNENAFNFKWSDFFSKTQQKEQKIHAPKKGENVYSDVEISIFEAINGTVKVINMLQTQVCSKCGGRRFINGTECSACKGKGENSTYKRFSVKIPAGIKNKSKIRLAGEGEKGLNGGENGDLYLTIHIREPKGYQTEGLNILKTIAITPSEAVLGCNLPVVTLAGNVSLKISPNTKNGQKIRLSNCGIEQNNKIGDMIVTVVIQIPKNLSDEEISLYKRLQEISGVNIRERME